MAGLPLFLELLAVVWVMRLYEDKAAGWVKIPAEAASHERDALNIRRAGCFATSQGLDLAIFQSSNPSCLVT